MDGSPTASTGALVLKFIKSYLWDEWIVKGANGCLVIDDHEPYTLTSDLVLKFISPTYGMN